MGKEGNQASAFADYAIPRFKDLRRLLFLHGTSAVTKLTYGVLWSIFKSTIFGTSVWFFNFWNGLSGHHTVDDLLWGMYSLLMTNFAIAFYMVYDQIIPIGAINNEEKLPF